MNNVILIGRLCADPETKFGASGSAITNFRLAVDRRFKREGDADADFFNCVSFGKTAEFVEKYFHKGSRIVVMGEVRNNNYTDKNGNTIYGMQIVVNQVEFGESKNGESNNSNNSKPSDDFLKVDETAGEELPFT